MSYLGIFFLISAAITGFFLGCCKVGADSED